jgi:hypothetical protein
MQQHSIHSMPSSISNWPDREAVHVSGVAMGRKKTSEKHADRKVDLTAKKGHSLLAKDFASKIP